MAFVEKRGQWHRIIFRYAGSRYAHTLKTKDRTVAEGLKGGVERTLMLLEQHVLQVPAGSDVLAFILSNGEVEKPAAGNGDGGVGGGRAAAPISLRELKDRYVQTHSAGAMEKNS